MPSIELYICFFFSYKPINKLFLKDPKPNLKRNRNLTYQTNP